jgi:hypothetical protein
MRFASALEGGLTGATTLTLLQEALHKLDSHAPRPLLHKSGIIKEIKKNASKQGGNNTGLYIKLAGELLSSVAYFGLAGFGKNKNALLRGGLLGAAAGLGSAFLQNDKEATAVGVDGAEYTTESTKKKVLTVTMYTVGGLLAGAAIQKLNEKPNKKGEKKSKKIKKLSKGTLFNKHIKSGQQPGFICL